MGWLARWRAVEDAEVRWLALCLAERAGATPAQLEALAERRIAERRAGGASPRRDPAALLAAVKAAGLWPGEPAPPADETPAGCRPRAGASLPEHADVLAPRGRPATPPTPARDAADSGG